MAFGWWGLGGCCCVLREDVNIQILYKLQWVINSKVNFYFYKKKKGNQNNIKHIRRI